MYQLLLFTFLCASALAAGPISLPSNFKVCSKSDRNVNNCLKTAIQSALVNLVQGSRQLGLLSVDPLKLTSLGINQEVDSAAIKLNFRDLLISGISHVHIDTVDTHLEGDTKTLTVRVSTSSPLILRGQYTINGKVLVLPISGTGNSEIELAGADASITLTGKTVTKNGETYLVFNSMQFLLNPKKVHFHFENLFNGDKALGDNMNMFLNENWEVVYVELKEPIQKAFASTFIEIANRIFTKVPYDRIFLP